jgi:hypothetical protein
LRDWFAGLVMQAWMSRPEFRVHKHDEVGHATDICYFMADAMIHARQKSQ